MKSRRIEIPLRPQYVSYLHICETLREFNVQIFHENFRNVCFTQYFFIVILYLYQGTRRYAYM